MHPSLLDMFHDTTDNDVAKRITQSVNIQFRRLVEIFIDQNWAFRIDFNSCAQISLQLRWCGNNFHRTSTENVRRTNHDRVTNTFCCTQSFTFVNANTPSRLSNIEFLEDIHPSVSIFRGIDRIWRCAENVRHAIA